MAAQKGGKKTAVRRRRERKNIDRGAAHIPVSYTHLDVYKRQGYPLGQARSWI